MAASENVLNLKCLYISLNPDEWLNEWEIDFLPVINIFLFFRIFLRYLLPLSLRPPPQMVFVWRLEDFWRMLIWYSLFPKQINNPFSSSLITDLLPHCSTPVAQQNTREFLTKIMDILLDYVNVQNDRKEKILDFHHPEDMKKLLDLELTEDPVQLQQLINDCALTLKYQVKTGKFSIHLTPFIVHRRIDQITY